MGSSSRTRRRLNLGLLSALIAAAMILAPGVTAATSSSASAGTPDPTFGTGGTTTVAVGTAAGAAAVAVQSDGKIVTAGQTVINGQNMILSTRMTATGALDPTYGTGGIVTVAINGSAGVDSGAAIALQPDGKIVIAGSGRIPHYGPLAFAAVRLNSDGSLDQSFGQGGIVTVAIGAAAIANAVVVEPDGKIALSGGALLSGHNQFAAVMLNADGSIDQSFGSGGIVTLPESGCAWGMVLQPDGKLVLAGQTDYTTPAGTQAQQFLAARLNPDGTLDQSFGQSGVVTLPIGSNALGFGIALQPDGKLILTGLAFTTTEMNATVRLNSDGTLDPTFGNGGISTFPDWDGVNGIVLDPQGRIVLPTVGPGAIRLNSDGTPDLTFGAGGNALAKLSTAGAQGANGAAIQSADGNIVLAGAATINGQTVLTVVRLLGQGTGTTPPTTMPTTTTTTTTTTAKPTTTTTTKTTTTTHVQVNAPRPHKLKPARRKKSPIATVAAHHSRHRRRHRRRH